MSRSEKGTAGGGHCGRGALRKGGTEEGGNWGPDIWWAGQNWTTRPVGSLPGRAGPLQRAPGPQRMRRGVVDGRLPAPGPAPRSHSPVSGPRGLGFSSLWRGLWPRRTHGAGWAAVLVAPGAPSVYLQVCCPRARAGGACVCGVAILLDPVGTEARGGSGAARATLARVLDRAGRLLPRGRESARGLLGWKVFLGKSTGGISAAGPDWVLVGAPGEVLGTRGPDCVDLSLPET